MHYLNTYIDNDMINIALTFVIVIDIRNGCVAMALCSTYFYDLEEFEGFFDRTP